MRRWSFRTQGACGIEVTGELLLPDGADGVCRIKILTVAGHPQAMGFVPRPDWGRFRSPHRLEARLRRRGWSVERTALAGSPVTESVTLPGGRRIIDTKTSSGGESHVRTHPARRRRIA
jgi:hypothetical protein